MKNSFKLLIFTILVCVLISHCKNEKIEIEESIQETNKLVNNFEEKNKKFKQKYNFDVDSLANKIYEKSNGNQESLEFPIIIYANQEQKLILAGINQSLKKEQMSFNIDSIKTIVVLESFKTVSGTYSDNSIIGKKWNTNISFINKNSKREITNITLVGGNPPLTIKYQRSSGNKYDRTGSSVSNQEIIQTIDKIISND